METIAIVTSAWLALDAVIVGFLYRAGRLRERGVRAAGQFERPRRMGRPGRIAE